MLKSSSHVVLSLVSYDTYIRKRNSATKGQEMSVNDRRTYKMERATYKMRFYCRLCSIAKTSPYWPANFVCKFVDDVLSADFSMAVARCQPNTRFRNNLQLAFLACKPGGTRSARLYPKNSAARLGSHQTFITWLV